MTLDDLRTASVFEVMVMAGTLLEAQDDGRALTAWEKGQLELTITESPSPPVRAVWRSFGVSPWLERQTEIFGSDETNSVGDRQSVWGRTTTSAKDQADLMRQALLGHWGPRRESYRAEAWDLMISVVSSQTWGVTEGVPCAGRERDRRLGLLRSRTMIGAEAAPSFKLGEASATSSGTTRPRPRSSQPRP